MSAIYRHFTQAQLDKEYSPSSCVENINLYLQRYAQTSREVRKALAGSPGCLTNLRYGNREKQTLDLFLPENHNRTPLHIFIHGGYWQQLDKSDGSFGAPPFLKSGAAYCALNYTLAPDANLDEIVEEIRLAIAWLYCNTDEFGYDRERFFLSGSSAGGHLAAMMLYTNWQKYQVPQDVIKGLCAVSGIYDLEPIRLTYVNEPLCLTDQQVYDNSPIQHQPLVNCPVIVAYGANETDEFKRQSIEYQALLGSQGIEPAIQEIAGRNHFDVVMDITNPESWLAKQVLAQLK